MIPLGIIAIIATFILITDSLDEGKASSGDKKRSKHVSLHEALYGAMEMPVDNK